MKKLLTILLACTMLLSIGITSVSAVAATQETEKYPYATAGDDVKTTLTEEQYNGLPDYLKKSAWLYGIPNVEECENSNKNRAVTASHFIPNFAAFEYYVAGDFEQDRNVCMPTAVANCLSYFDSLGRSGLISGSRMSQAEFTELCNACEWTSSYSPTLTQGANGLYRYCRARSYTATDFSHTFNLWTNIKSNLDNDYPVLVAEPAHADFCTGYKVENGNHLLYIYTGNVDMPIAWLDFNECVSGFDRIWIS